MSREERVTVHPAVEVVLEEEDGAWGASVPALPGCVAAARSRDEVQALIEEALGHHLAQMAIQEERALAMEQAGGTGTR
jgi:predicted RNase H-like HicB family nuclease